MDYSVIVYIRPLSVYLWLLFILFRIARWPSAGKELSSWLSARAVFILYCLNCMCSFPVWCLRQDVEFDCVGSWSLPFHLLNLSRPNVVCIIHRAGGQQYQVLGRSD